MTSDKILSTELFESENKYNTRQVKHKGIISFSLYGLLSTKITKTSQELIEKLKLMKKVMTNKILVIRPDIREFVKKIILIERTTEDNQIEHIIKYELFSSSNNSNVMHVNGKYSSSDKYVDLKYVDYNDNGHTEIQKV